MKHLQQFLNTNYNFNQEDLLHYCLRTARHKRRAVLEHRDKRLLALNRESDVLHKAKREQPWTELNPPIMRGWKRFFIVREDVAKSRDGAHFERILEKINTVQYYYRRDFKKKKRKFGRKIYVVAGQSLKKLDVWEWKKAAFTEKEAACFDLREEPASYPKGAVKYVYVFRESWRYVLRVRPNLITKVKVPDMEIESRLAQIDGYIDRNVLNRSLDKLLRGAGYRYWKWDEKCDDPKYGSIRVFKNVPLHQKMNDEY